MEDAKLYSLDASEDETYDMHEVSNNTFLANLRDMWEKGILCDLMLTVDKNVFRAHKVVLSAHSEYFRQMFSNPVTKDQLKVPLLGIKSHVVKLLLQAIYQGNITLTTSSVDDVLTAASYLRINAVVKLCGEYIKKKLSVLNCLRTIQVAHMYGLSDLLEAAYVLACKNFSCVTQQEKFKRMRYCEVQAMLHRQDVQVESELEVFNAVISWLDCDRSTRLTYAGRLMRYVRFPLISENDLVDKVEGCASLDGIPEIVDLVREAIRYHLLPYRKSILQNSRTIPRSTYEEDVVVCTGGLRDKADNEVMQHVFCYTPSSKQWVPFTQLPEPRHHHAVAVLGGFMYVAGGSSNQSCLDSSDKVWRYDTWNDEWIQVASMHSPRQSFQLGVLDSFIYAVGGRANMNDALNKVERYDPGSNKWSKQSPINSPRRHVAITALNGRLYAAGGSSSDMISRRVERFNPQTLKWEKRHPLLKPRFSASLHAVKNRLWLIGGATVKENDPGCGVTGVWDVESYSVSADQWTLVTKKISWLNNSSITNCSTENLRRATQGESAYSNDSIHVYENGILEPRAEAGSCSIGDKVFLVAGYSWNKRSRINTSECIDVSQLALRAWASGKSTFRKNSNDSLPDNNDHAQFVMEYPVKCAGVGCCTLKILKKPNNKINFETLDNNTKQKTKSTKERPQTCVHKKANQVEQNESFGGSSQPISTSHGISGEESSSSLRIRRKTAVKKNNEFDHKVNELMSLTYQPSDINDDDVSEDNQEYVKLDEDHVSPRSNCKEDSSSIFLTRVKY